MEVLLPHPPQTGGRGDHRGRSRANPQRRCHSPPPHWRGRAEEEGEGWWGPHQPLSDLDCVDANARKGGSHSGDDCCSTFGRPPRRTNYSPPLPLLLLLHVPSNSSYSSRERPTQWRGAVARHSSYSREKFQTRHGLVPNTYYCSLFHPASASSSNARRVGSMRNYPPHTGAVFV